MRSGAPSYQHKSWPWCTCYFFTSASLQNGEGPARLKGGTAMPDIEARSITPITILFRIYLSLLSKCHGIFSSILFHCCLLVPPWYHLKIIDFVTSYFFISLFFFFSLLSLDLCKVLKVSIFDKTFFLFHLWDYHTDFFFFISKAVIYKTLKNELQQHKKICNCFPALYTPSHFLEDNFSIKNQCQLKI